MPNRHEIREGDVVSVRILSQTGQNSYIASFAGGRFSVTSERPLVQGAVFSASVSIKDGTLVLSPLIADVSFSNEHFITTFSTALNPDGTISDAELVRYFTLLNLPPDYITLSLFTAMQQLGMKFDEKIFTDARRIALSFPGREKEAAQAALLLEQKGIAMEKDAVAAIVGENEKNDRGAESDADSQSGGRAERGGADKKSGSDPQNGGKNENAGESDLSRRAISLQDGIDTERPLKDLVPEIESEVRCFFCGVLSGRTLEQSEGGVLTLFNHRGFSSGASWIQLPIEISLDGGDKTGNGILRFFADARQKKAEKYAATLDFGGQFYYFVIYLHKERNRVLYAASGEERAGERALLKKALEAAFGGKSFSVERTESGVLSGFFEKSGISVVRGSV